MKYKWLFLLVVVCFFLFSNCKEGYDSPFLINVASWHRVYIDNPGSIRLSLVFQSKQDTPFSSFRKMHESGELLK